LKSFLAVSKQFTTNLIITSFSQDRIEIRLWQWHISVCCLFITERWTEGKLVTQWSKNLSHWVTSFRQWVTFFSPSCSVKRCSGITREWLQQGVSWFHADWRVVAAAAAAETD